VARFNLAKLRRLGHRLPNIFRPSPSALQTEPIFALHFILMAVLTGLFISRPVAQQYPWPQVYTVADLILFHDSSCYLPSKAIRPSSAGNRFAKKTKYE
jgi:hypothetical protein